ncbi:DUF2262 domain-containing protein [Tautonia rosea]|uniref:DUF2262 domain-containing protein n=1 Tax=Tautonia rosea TaxID=2728037 RepID=UPI0014761005|nr:DUF2262 domain-containing protein [Tautonia rosea]
MSEHEAIDDPVLGRLRWDAVRGEWVFAFTVPSGKSVRGGITPEDSRLPLEHQGLTEIRDCVSWIVSNEPSIRAFIADHMFEGWKSGWYNEEIDEVITKEGFQEAISMSGVSILEDRVATLYYNDAGLFGGHAIVLSVRGRGEHFIDEPQLWG